MSLYNKTIIIYQDKGAAVSLVMFIKCSITCWLVIFLLEPSFFIFTFDLISVKIICSYIGPRSGGPPWSETVVA